MDKEKPLMHHITSRNTYVLSANKISRRDCQREAGWPACRFGAGLSPAVFAVALSAVCGGGVFRMQQRPCLPSSSISGLFRLLLQVQEHCQPGSKSTQMITAPSSVDTVDSLDSELKPDRTSVFPFRPSPARQLKFQFVSSQRFLMCASEEVLIQAVEATAGHTDAGIDIMSQQCSRFLPVLLVPGTCRAFQLCLTLAACCCCCQSARSRCPEQPIPGRLAL